MTDEKAVSTQVRSENVVYIEGRGMMPKDLSGAWRLAVLAHKGGMKGFPSPEAAAQSILYGLELNPPLSPQQSLNSIAVINGRTSIYGATGLALVRVSGKLKSYDQRYEGKPYDDDYRAVVKAERTNGEVYEHDFSVADAKRAGLWGKQGPWMQYPKRMLMFRARGFVLNDGFGDILKGMRTTEEVMDIAESQPGVYEAPKEPFEMDFDNNGIVMEPENKVAMFDRKAQTAGLEGELWEDFWRFVCNSNDMESNACKEMIVTENDFDELVRHFEQYKEQRQVRKSPTAMAYNGPPDGVKMDGTPKEAEPEPEPTPDPPVDLEAWDPRTEPVQERYVAAKRAALQIVAGDMGLDIKGLKPAEVHASIRDLYAEQAEPETEPEPPAEPQTAEPKPDLDRDELINLAMRTRAHNQARWDAIARERIKLGQVDAPMFHTWPAGVIKDVIKEFKAVEDGGEW